MRAILGVSVGRAGAHAVLVRAGKVQWAGSALYGGAADLAETVARLAGECATTAHRARVVLERDIVQTRTVQPAPPISSGTAAGYVDLQRPRLFNAANGPLVTDGTLVPLGGSARALWAAAAPEWITRAIVEGCAQAGLELKGLGPAAEVLPQALRAVPVTGTLSFPNGNSTEVLEVHRARTWRSRLLPGVRGDTPDWAPALMALGNEAPRFAAAYAAATARPRLLLLPGEARIAREARALRATRRLAMAAAVTWGLSAGVYFGRLVSASAVADRELIALAPAIDSALTLRRDLASAVDAIETIDRARAERSRHLPLLADLTAALGDSTALVNLRVGPGGAVRLVGYAERATRVLAELERVPGVRGARLEGPPTGELIASSGGRHGLERERFSILANRERAP